MSDITLTTWGHAGIRLEREGRRLVIDPGMFTDPAVLDGADAVLITHEHPDHFEAARLKHWLSGDPDRNVLGPESVISQLTGVDASQSTAVSGGDSFMAADFEVRGVGHRHAQVHPDIPVVANIAYLVEGSIFHPGDSFTAPPSDTSILALALPISAPWLKIEEAVDYLRMVRPSVAIPVHDGILNDEGKALHDRVIGGLADGVEYRRVHPGTPLTVSAGN